MGYSTDFSGSISIDKPLTEVQLDFFDALSNTRRMQRDTFIIPNGEDELHNRVGLGMGEYGEFYVGDESVGVINNNKPAPSQAGLWCGLNVTSDEDGKNFIEWNYGEKFYSYVEWMAYIVNILDGWGYKCNGEIEWCGEESEDLGLIKVKDNVVTAHDGEVSYGESEEESEAEQKEMEALVNSSMKKGLELALEIVEGLKKLNSEDPRVQVSTVCNSIIVEINKFEKVLSK